MLVGTRDLVSYTEANQNFSRLARMIDERGAVAALRRNAPRHGVIDFDRIEDVIASGDEVLAAGAEFIHKYREAFDEMAQPRGRPADRPSGPPAHRLPPASAAGGAWRDAQALAPRPSEPGETPRGTASADGVTQAIPTATRRNGFIAAALVNPFQINRFDEQLVVNCTRLCSRRS